MGMAGLLLDDMRRRCDKTNTVRRFSPRPSASGPRLRKSIGANDGASSTATLLAFADALAGQKTKLSQNTRFVPRGAMAAVRMVQEPALSSWDGK